MAQNKIKTYTFSGGEDHATSDLEMPEGMSRNALNYEQDYNAGYSRIKGYVPYVHPDDSDLPGEGAILGLVMVSGFLIMFRRYSSDYDSDIGLWVLFPSPYFEDGTLDTGFYHRGGYGSQSEIYDSAGVVTTLSGEGAPLFSFVPHNFKATGNTNIEDFKYYDYLGDAQIGTIADATVYGVDGVNPAFELTMDTVNLIPILRQIDSTYTPDNPRHIEANGNRLALGFGAGEIAMSALGDPFDFDPINGAGSIGVTDLLTGMSSNADGSMTIYTLNKTYMYYGMNGDLADSELKKHSKGLGSFPYTQGDLGENKLAWGKYGLTNLAASEKFGNVLASSITNKVKILYEGLRCKQGVVLRDKAQYRLYFDKYINDGVTNPIPVLCVTLLKDDSLAITHLLYPFEITAITYGYEDDIWYRYYGDIHTVGTEDGDVFRMDFGHSFNGAAYTSRLTMPFTHMGSPGYEKKFKKVVVNMDTSEETDVQVSVDFGYGRATDTKDVILGAEGSLWDASTWNNFTWSGNSVGVLEYYVNGHGENASITISTTGDDKPSHTLKDIQWVYENKRIQH